MGKGWGLLLGIGGQSPKFLGGLLSDFRVVAIPELLRGVSGGVLFGIFESQGGRTTPRDPPPNSMYAQNARFSTKITNFSPHKNPSGLVGFHCRVRVFLGFSSKVGFRVWVWKK